MSGYDYHKPGTLDEAFELKGAINQGMFIAGGTDVMVGIVKQVVRPPALISLRHIPELAGIAVGDTTRIGAGTTITDLVEHAALAERFPVLVEGARAIGSVQIRNLGTLGGNICNASPCADTAPPLLVLDARVGLRSPDGERELPLDDFFTGPKQTAIGASEILTHVSLDTPPAGLRAAFMKKGRVKMDLAVASLAVALELDGARCVKARVAAGSVAPVPLRLTAVEELLTGNEITDDLVAAGRALTSESVAPIDDVRSTAAYRRHVVGVYFQRCVEQILAGGAR